MKTKNNIAKIITLLAATLTMAACGDPNGSDTPVPTVVEREIVYSVAHEESRTTLRTEAEWDELLDRFCDYAMEGKEVAFYNLSSQPWLSAKGRPTVKDVVTFSTSNRAEMKEWMKAREKEGKTVNVSFDSSTGTWSGTAYATAPNPQPQAVGDSHTGVLTIVTLPPLATPPIPVDVWALVTEDDSTLILMEYDVLMTAGPATVNGYSEGDTATLYGSVYEMEDMDGNAVYLLDIAAGQPSSVAGTWHYAYSSTTVIDGSDFILSTTVDTPDEDVYYDFREDGTVTYRCGSRSEQGSWSLSADGMLCCDLFDMGGGCWNISWLSNSLMVLTRESSGTTFCQMVFET